MSDQNKIWSAQKVKWRLSSGLTPYLEALSYMEDRAAKIAANEAAEEIWLLEHPPLYTAGTSAQDSDLISPSRFPVYPAGRGGQYTYHGPGQRVAYVMLDLRQRGRDVAAFVRGLEQWIIDSLAEFNVTAERRCGRVGVWVTHDDGREEKIAAIGVRLRKWVSFHGIAINVNPDLSHFGGIIPCGISDHGVTSLKALGIDAQINDIDMALKAHFQKVFGPIN